MADGDVLVDSAQSLPDGTRVRLFAVESSTYPGGVNYRFQYYDPATGDQSSGTTTRGWKPTEPVTTTATSGLAETNR